MFFEKEMTLKSRKIWLYRLTLIFREYVKKELYSTENRLPKQSVFFIDFVIFLIQLPNRLPCLRQ